MIRRAALIGWVLIAVVRAASASPADAIDALLAERKAFEAHEVATRAVEARPDDPDARYQAARMALAIYDRPLADEHMARGLAVAPDHAPLLGLAAMERMHAGALDEARALAERAVAADAAQADARDVLAQLQLVERARSREGIRVAQTGDDDLDPALSDGTAEAFVDRFVRMLFDAEPVARFVPMVDDSLLDVIPEHLREGSRLPEVLGELMAAWRAEQQDSEQSYLGWRVIASERLADGTIRVRVALPVAGRVNQAFVDRARRALVDPGERRRGSAAAIALFEATPPEHREGLAARMVGTPLLLVSELAVDVVERDGRTTIAELDWMGYSARRFFGGAIGEVASGAKPTERGSSAGLHVVTLLGITVVAGAVLALIFARGGGRRRRRRAG